MKKLTFLLLTLCLLFPSSIFAIDVLDATKPTTSTSLSQYGTYLRETRAKVNEVVENSPDLKSSIYVTAAYSPVAGDNLLIDTSATPATITLPAAPVTGTRIYVYDVKNTWNTNNVTLARNGNKIVGLASDYTISVGVAYTLNYSGASYGWMVNNGGLSVTNLSPSLSVFTDTNSNLITKSASDARTALGLPSTVLDPQVGGGFSTAGPVYIGSTVRVSTDAALRAALTNDSVSMIYADGPINQATSLHITKPFSAGDYTVFTGVGAVTFDLATNPVVKARWFGMVADFVSPSTGTDATAAFDAAVTATPIGGVLRIANGAYIFRSAPTAIAKYMTIEGDSESGYATAALWFYQCSGLHLEGDGHQVIRNLSIWHGGASAGAVNATAHTFRDVGITMGLTTHGTYFNLENVQVGYFDTGLYYGPQNAVYSKALNVDVYYNQIGIAMVGMATTSSFINVHVRANTVHGLYSEGSWAKWVNCLWEGNGFTPGNMQSADASKYGLWLWSGGTHDFVSCWLNDILFVDVDTIADLGNFMFETSFRAYGLGSISLSKAHVSPNILPNDMTKAWTYDTSVTLTNGGYYNRVQKSTSTAADVSFSDTSLNTILDPADVICYMFSVDVLVAGDTYSVSSISPYVTLYQSGGYSDSQDLTSSYTTSHYDWSDISVWKRINVFSTPRWDDGTHYLKNGISELSSIRASLHIVGTDFSAHALDLHVRNPSLTLYTKAGITERRLYPTPAIKNFTRDLAAVSGDVAYTGIGFKPSLIVARATPPDGGFNISLGEYTTVGGHQNMNTYAAGTWESTTSYFIALIASIGNTQTAIVKSFDADGFTLTWTKAGSPTGTANVHVVCYP